MGIEQKLRKVEDDSPLRCQYVFAFGQCQFEVLPGQIHCARHAASPPSNYENEKQIRNYRLNKWKARIDEFSESQFIKSLREEIAILRLMLEETLNKCHDSNDLLVYSSKISQLVLNIEKVVCSCHRLEGSLNMTLDKSMILYIATSIVDIVGKHIDDANVIDSIGMDVIKLITEKKDDEAALAG
jgi:hypothetical protein